MDLHVQAHLTVPGEEAWQYLMVHLAAFRPVQRADAAHDLMLVQAGAGDDESFRAGCEGRVQAGASDGHVLTLKAIQYECMIIPTLHSKISSRIHYNMDTT